MGLYKILKYLTYLIGGIGIILFFILIGKGDAEIIADADLQDSLLNPFLYLTYFVFFLTIAAILVFIIARFFGGGKLKNLFISLGVFVVIFLISFVMAGGSAITFDTGVHISGTGAKWMNTGLNMTYILGVVAILALLLSSVKKITYKK